MNEVNFGLKNSILREPSRPAFNYPSSLVRDYTSEIFRLEQASYATFRPIKQPNLQNLSLRHRWEAHRYCTRPLPWQEFQILVGISASMPKHHTEHLISWVTSLRWHRPSALRSLETLPGSKQDLQTTPHSVTCRISRCWHPKIEALKMETWNQRTHTKSISTVPAAHNQTEMLW